MKFPKLTNGQYDRIKQFLLMVVPAATAVITGIGVMNGFSTEKVTGTIALLATFAGILLNWIAGKYDKEEQMAYKVERNIVAPSIYATIKYWKGE